MQNTNTIILPDSFKTKVSFLLTAVGKQMLVCLLFGVLPKAPAHPLRDAFSEELFVYFNFSSLVAWTLHVLPSILTKCFVDLERYSQNRRGGITQITFLIVCPILCFDYFTININFSAANL